MHVQRLVYHGWPLSIPLDYLHSAHALIVHVQAEINCPELSSASDVPLHGVLVDRAHLALLLRGDTPRVNRGRAPLRGLLLGRDVALAREAARMVRRRVARAPRRHSALLGHVTSLLAVVADVRVRLATVRLQEPLLLLRGRAVLLHLLLLRLACRAEVTVLLKRGALLRAVRVL